jgi:hypothetical protein
LISQVFWSRLSLPIDRVTFLWYAATGSVFAVGGLLQVYFAEWCSFQNAKEEYGCPLPDFFNHNVIMHLIQVIKGKIFFNKKHLKNSFFLLINVFLLKNAVFC